MAYKKELTEQEKAAKMLKEEQELAAARDWMEAAHIPFDAKKQDISSPDATKSRPLTASTATIQRMEQAGWAFHLGIHSSNKIWEEEHSEDVRQAIRNDISLTNDAYIKVPGNWGPKAITKKEKVAVKNEPDITEELQELVLHPMLKAVRMTIAKAKADTDATKPAPAPELESESESEPEPEPKPESTVVPAWKLFFFTNQLTAVKELKNVQIVSLEDAFPKDHKPTAADGFLGTMSGVLRLSKPSKYEKISEITVEKMTGSFLPGFFNVPGCRPSAGQSLHHPDRFSLFRSIPKPDMAAAMEEFEVNGRQYPRLAPVIMIGEAKIAFTEKNKAQLACAVHPTLQVWAAHLTMSNQLNAGNWDEMNLPPKVDIPKWMRIYGVLYDKDGFQFFAFYPTYHLLKDDEGKITVNWIFNCMNISKEFTKLLEKMFASDRAPDMLSNSHLCRALMVMKIKASEIKKEMKETKWHLPDEILKLAEESTWEEDDLC